MQITANDFNKDFPNGSLVFACIKEHSLPCGNVFEAGWHIVSVLAAYHLDHVVARIVGGEYDGVVLLQENITDFQHINYPLAIPDAKKINTPYTVADNLANAQFTLRTQRGG